jgi:hypothetical protein
VRVRAACGGVLAAVLAISVTAVVTEPDRGPHQVIPAAAAATPLERARRILDRQAAALARGDLRGWLAAVDSGQPALRRRYQDLYRTLRALRVTTVEYRVAASAPLPFAEVALSYCFAADRCGAAIGQALTFRPAGSGYVISGLAVTSAQPSPWEAGDLVFAQGRQVTVGAPRALAGRLAEVVALADRAAAVDDRFAAYAENPQPRYRLFLATGRLWRAWYGGREADWVAGYMRPLGPAGGDAVINMSRIRGLTALRSVIQHEFGHVATIGGVAPSHDDMWLVEGVAEYAAARPSPRPPQLSSPLPPSIVLRPLRDGAERAEVTAFYAAARSAVECLAATFGEPRAMEFVRLRLRLGDTLDAASRSVFGRPFAAVDNHCAHWIAHQAR